MASVLQLLREMIAIPSVNPMRANSGAPAEGEMANFVEAVLVRADIDCKRQTVADGRDNVIGIVHSTNSNRNGLMLNSHMDTVPVDNMSIEPFDPVIKNGCVFGRGSCDAKASIAAMLAAVIDYANQRDRPAPAVFAAMADEEFGFSGSWKLIEDSWPVAACIVGEPTQLRRVIAHKGIIRWRINIRGLSAHGATPELGRNAIYDAARVALGLEVYGKEMAKQQPHPLLGHSTLNLGKVTGGQAINIVPDKCVLDTECRLLPSGGGQQMLRDCEQFLRERLDESVQLEFEDPYLIDPPLETAADAEIVAALARAQQEALGVAHEIAGANYGTDGSKISRVGIQTVVCGPGNIAQAHTADEFVEIEQVELATRMYRHMLATWQQ